MSMTKQQKIGVGIGSAYGVAVLVLGWFLYSAYAERQEILEGKTDEVPEGLEEAKQKNANFYTQSNPFPSKGAIDAIVSNKTKYLNWKVEARKLASQGDCPPPPAISAPHFQEKFLTPQIKEMKDKCGLTDDSMFGFELYASAKPEEKDLPMLWAQLTTITNVVDLLVQNDAKKIKIERVLTKAEGESDEQKDKKQKRGNKGNKKSQQVVEPDPPPMHYDYKVDFAVLPPGLAKVLNGLAKSPHFYVVSEFGFEREGESLKAYLDNMGSGAKPKEKGKNSKSEAAREKKEPIVAVRSINPESDEILVHLLLSVYDFGKGGENAKGAESATKSSQTEVN